MFILPLLSGHSVVGDIPFAISLTASTKEIKIKEQEYKNNFPYDIYTQP